MSSAASFLTLLDQEQYSQCWDATSKLFQLQTRKETWEGDVHHIRAYFGTLAERSLSYLKPLEHVEGAPTGRYASLIFSSRFVNDKKAVEIVTLSLEEDGVWRVAGYNIQ